MVHALVLLVSCCIIETHVYLHNSPVLVFHKQTLFDVGLPHLLVSGKPLECRHLNKQNNVYCSCKHLGYDMDRRPEYGTLHWTKQRPERYNNMISIHILHQVGLLLI